MDRERTLNVVITGQLRCGASVVQTSLASCMETICHPELLHLQSGTRQKLHEESFGASPPNMPLHFIPGNLSAEQYLNGRVFDRPYATESVVGVKILYPHLEKWALWEYLHDRCLEGDFAVIHIRRNPLACFVSLKQAEVYGRWYQHWHAGEDYVPEPITIDPQEFTTFCRQHLAHEAKLQQMVDDRLEIEYQELFLDYQRTMKGVFSYLELNPCAGCHGCPCPRISPGVRRMRNRSIRARVRNFEEAQRCVPGDVRPHFESANMF